MTEGDSKTTQVEETAVRAQIVLDVPIEHAFAVFTKDASWKPTEHNLLGVDIAESVFEAREGGYIYDRGVDGSECGWARVLAYDPPNRVLFAWLINPQWRIQSADSPASEVEVRFIAETPKRTRVEVEHSHLERHGDSWEAMREAVSSPRGWALYLKRLEERVSG